MKKYLFFILVFLPLVFLGCSGIDDISVVKIKDVTYQEFKGNVLKLSVTATVNNPNRFNVKIRKANMDLVFNNKVIGTATQVEQIELFGRKEQDYKILISIEMKELLSNMLNLYRVLMNEPKNLSLSGTVQVKYFLFSRTIQVDRLSFA